MVSTRSDPKRLAALFLCSLIWGTAFSAQSMGAEEVGPYTFMAFRSLLALGFVFCLYLIRQRLAAKGPNGQQGGFKNPALWKTAALSGTFMCVASIMQQIGIAHTTAAKSGFITTMYIVLVPLFSTLFLKNRQGPVIWLSVALDVAGLYLLSVKDGFSLSYGDGITLLCAVFFAMQILTIDRFARDLDSISFSAVQLLTATVISFAAMLLFDRDTPAAIMRAMPYIAYAGIFSGGIAYTLQIIGQKGTNPTVASLIMCMESVFAALAGFIFLRQTLSPRELAGCALMFAAIVLSQLLPAKPSKQAA